MSGPPSFHPNRPPQIPAFRNFRFYHKNHVPPFLMEKAFHQKRHLPYFEIEQIVKLEEIETIQQRPIHGLVKKRNAFEKKLAHTQPSLNQLLLAIVELIHAEIISDKPVTFILKNGLEISGYLRGVDYQGNCWIDLETQQYLPQICPNEPQIDFHTIEWKLDGVEPTDQQLLSQISLTEKISSISDTTQTISKQIQQKSNNNKNNPSMGTEEEEIMMKSSAFQPHLFLISASSICSLHLPKIYHPERIFRKEAQTQQRKLIPYAFKVRKARLANFFKKRQSHLDHLTQHEGTFKARN